MFLPSISYYKMQMQNFSDFIGVYIICILTFFILLCQFPSLQYMQASTQEKQLYLRQQILQSHYDADEFVSFLSKDLGIEQLDVDHLSMAELESIVLKFKQYKYYQQQNKPQPAKPTKKVKIDYQKNCIVYDYQFEDVCRCIHTESLMSTVEVFIPNFEVKQIEGVFFSLGSRTQIWYLVQSNIAKQPLKRVNQDFQWLSTTLARLYPLLAIPELIPISKENQTNYQKRRKQLEQYLQIISKRQQLRSSSIFFDFLTTPSQKMEKLKKNSESLGFAKGIQSIKSLQGSVKLSLNNKIRFFAQNSAVYNRKAQFLHESIAASIEKVNQLYDQASKEINKIVDYYAQLHQSYNELINKSPQQKISEYNEILININNLFHVLSDSLKTTSKVVQSSLKQYHKISVNHDRSIQKVYKNVFQTEKDYVSFKLNLNRRKERIYPDINKWETDQKMLQNRRLSKEEAFDIMLPKQTMQQQEQKYWMAYLYGNYREEFQKYISFQTKRYVEVYCTFCSEILLNNKAYVQQLTKFIQQSKKIEIKV